MTLLELIKDLVHLLNNIDINNIDTLQSYIL